jgi:hypothetical protein
MIEGYSSAYHAVDANSGAGDYLYSAGVGLLSTVLLVDGVLTLATLGGKALVTGSVRALAKTLGREGAEELGEQAAKEGGERALAWGTSEGVETFAERALAGADYGPIAKVMIEAGEAQGPCAFSCIAAYLRKTGKIAEVTPELAKEIAEKAGRLAKRGEGAVGLTSDEIVDALKGFGVEVSHQSGLSIKQIADMADELGTTPFLGIDLGGAHLVWLESFSEGVARFYDPAAERMVEISGEVLEELERRFAATGGQALFPPPAWIGG